MNLLITITTLFATTTRAACECGYTISNSSATFTKILETDFLHTTALNKDWISQTYNVTQLNSNGPYGKIAQEQNIMPNPLANRWDWGGDDDPGLQLFTKPPDAEGLVPMSEIVSVRDDILYGSFRIGMKTTPINGTCGAFFFYLNDTVEIDLEFLSRQPNATNLVIQSPQSAAAGYVQPFQNTPLPFDPSSGYHEYRFDWLPSRVDFYADSILLSSITENIPSAAGRLHISHWSNGNAGWSGGPPAEEAKMVVSYVKAYFNSSQEGGGCGEGGEKCVIPDQLVPPDPGGVDGNVTGKTFFFLGTEETTDGDDGGGDNGTSSTKGAATRFNGNGSSSMTSTLLILVAVMMLLA